MNIAPQLHPSVPVDRLVFTLQLLGDNTRFNIYKLLQANNKLCVSEIAQNLGVTVSAVSQHFRNFEQLGLVDKSRNGLKICYHLRSNDPLVDGINKLIKLTGK